MHMMSFPDDSRVINALIKVTIDSADGYRKAADEANNHAFQSIFYERANEREQLVEKMQDFVRSRGGEPADDGSMTAGAHRMFMELRDAIMGNDDEAIISEVERGEDYIKAAFEEERKRSDISSDARDLIEQCYVSVKSGHDQMRDLKHGVSRESSNAQMPM
jgi:uncharacterized protein (TIGR02284 family)